MLKINKIKMIYTGGTIGMQMSIEGLVPDRHSIQQFLARSDFDCQIDLVCADPLIDSSDLDLFHWNQWIRLINQDLEAYQGVVVLHGTDTLAYTAALLSLVYSQQSVPIIITGAMKPLYQPDSDGRQNLALSIEVLEVLERGVAVVFDGKLLNAADCVKVSTLEYNAFLTPHTPILASYTDEYWQFHPNFSYDQIVLDRDIDYKNFRLRTDVKVLTLLITPSFDSMSMLAAGEWEALILKTFGNGHFRLDERIKQVIEVNQKQFKPMLNISQVLSAKVDETYALGADISKLGLISGRALSFEFCYVATLLALSLFSSAFVQTEWLEQTLLVVDRKLAQAIKRTVF